MARILQVTASTDRRGAEVFAHQLSAAMSARGHIVSTVALRGPLSEGALDQQVLPFRVLGPSRAHLATLTRLTVAVRDHDVTIVHGGSGLWPAMAAAAVTRRPFIYRSIGDPTFWGEVRLGQLRIGLPLRRADRVVALYPTAADQLTTMYRLRPSAVEVITNAVPAGDFPARTPASRAGARRALGIDENVTLLGYLGALSTEKRPEWAIRTVAELGDAHLVVAGAGPQGDEVQHLAGELVEGRVHFLGAVDDPLSVLAAIDVLLVPSRTEGVPACLLEAAFVGVPVVATAVGGVPDTMRSAKAGAPVDPDDLHGFIDTVRSVLAGRGSFVPDRAAAIAGYDLGVVTDRWVRLIEHTLDRR